MTFTDPGIDIQGAIFKALKNAGGVRDLVGDRIYDRVPRNQNGDPNSDFPFVSFGETQTLPELAECTDAAETFFTLHTWSRRVGKVEAKDVNRAVTVALHDADLPGVQSILLQDSRIVPDPDGLTTHGILTFQLLTDANA